MTLAFIGFMLVIAAASVGDPFFTGLGVVLVVVGTLLDGARL